MKTKGLRRALCALAFAAISTAGTANAGVIGWTPWVQFVLGGQHAGQSAIVAEQIRLYKDCLACLPYYDYDFRVLNTSIFNPLAPNDSVIDGFALGVGAAAFGALGLQYADVAGGGDGLFPAAAITNNGIPFLGVNFVPAGFFYGFNGLAGLGWGFSEYDDRPALTSYAVRFYAPVQGIGNGIPVGAVARFDLYSLFGPVPGTGGVDPWGAGNFFNFDANGVDNTFANALDTPNLLVCGDGGNAACVGSEADAVPSAFVPEPGSLFLMGGGMLAIGFVLRKRRK